jgi:hypothetical protein
MRLLVNSYKVLNVNNVIVRNLKISKVLAEAGM